MHGNILNKNKIKLFNTANSDLAGRIIILENNVYKITYYEIISGASGTLTIPTAATINADEFSGADCILSEIDGNNKPTWVSPKTVGGTVVTATLNTGTGAWVKSGVTASANVALIYSLNIRAADYANLTNFYIVEETVIGDLSYILNNTTVNSVASSLLSGVMSDETGTGALVFGTSPTFTTSVTINGDQVINIGTGKMSILAFSGSQVAMYMNNTTAAGATNYAVLTSNSTAIFNGRTNMSLAVGGTSYFALNPAADTVMFNFSNAVKTGNTASLEVPYFKIIGASQTWNGGNISIQRWNWITANTAAFTSLSTIGDSYSVYIEKTVLGSNAAITRNWALGLNGSIQIANNTTISGLDSGGTSRDLMTWSSGDNITISGRAGISDIVLNPTSGGIGLYVKSGGDGGIGVASPSARWHILKTTEQLRVGYDASNYLSTTISASGEVTNTITGSTRTFNFTSAGSIAMKVTSTAVTTYLGSDGSGGYVGSNTAHAFRIFAGNTERLSFASGVAGACTVADGLNFILNTTTGSILATAASQKLGIWGATPIVQPTTGVAAATVVNGAGTNVKHDDTFDGYTLDKIVKALRNIGLLA